MFRALRPTVVTTKTMRPHVHGYAPKDLFVCHETVSHDLPGLADGNNVMHYLAEKDYGIHAVIDEEAHLWWATGLSTAIFYHCSSTDPSGVSHLVNTRSIGCELVSYPTGNTRLMTAEWRRRTRQLWMLSRLIEAQSRMHRFPLVVSDGSHPGVTTHYQVSKRFNVPGGHVDCYPGLAGGYFPLYRVVMQARAIRAARLGRLTTTLH